MNNPLDFSGKVALVTGAASGMGLATAQAFAEAGAAVALADFREGAVLAEAEKLVSSGHKAIAVRCDVSDDAQVAAMVDRAVVEFGRVDAAFNNAGVMARIAPTADSTREEWDRVIGINLRGVWSCMKYELREMERQGSGNRQQRLCWRVDWQSRYRFLHCIETWLCRTDADGGSGIHQTRHPRKRSPSGAERHTNSS
jgi:NAD(P)-dependent dehydrogenase (short-subunit alcohol dehydrogenase family)